MKKLDMMDKIITQVPIWELRCLPDDESAILSHAAMTKT